MPLTMGVKKPPKVKDLQAEYAKLLEEKKKTYAEYRRSREEMRELLTAKAENVDRLLKMDEEQKKEQATRPAVSRSWSKAFAERAATERNSVFKGAWGRCPGQASGEENHKGIFFSALCVLTQALLAGISLKTKFAHSTHYMPYWRKTY